LHWKDLPDTPKGRQALKAARKKIRELFTEIVGGHTP
jgi:hypothetical protein